MDSQRRRIIREELLRSIAWIGLGIVGWPILISEVAWVDATALTVFGLPVLTWALLTAGMIGVRAATAAELQVQSPAGVSVSLLLGVMGGGVGAVYLVAVGAYPPLWIAVAYIAVTVGFVCWYWYTGLPELTSETAA
jgi:FtsH-binding integral membrane protein